MEFKTFFFESIKILGSALVGFLLAMWGTKIGRNMEIEQRSKSIARLLASEVFIELQSIVLVANGVANNIQKDKFIIDPRLFQNVYSPTSEITSFNDIGLLSASIVDTYVSYRQMIRVCENYRRAYIDALTSNKKDAPVTYFTYLIGLDAVTKRGRNLLAAILQQYQFEEYKQIPEYAKSIDFDELRKHLPSTPKININENR